MTSDLNEPVAGLGWAGLSNFAYLHVIFNRPTMYLEVKKRPPSTGGQHDVAFSFTSVIDPMLHQLRQEGKQYDRTIIYLPLKWCGYIHHRAVTQ